MEAINNLKQRVEGLIASGYNTDAGKYISKGYNIFKKDMGMFIGYTALYLLISGAASCIPFFGSVLLTGPLTAGFFIAARKINKNEPYDFGTFWKGFDFFVPLMLYTLISTILGILAFIALIIPGIYLVVGWVFAVPFIVFGNMEFWDAMEYSRRLVTKRWWNLFGFLILLVLINIAGALVFFVGLLFTIPVTYCALYAAFEDIAGTE
jgi:uncharacterized membrane protein